MRNKGLLSQKKKKGQCWARKSVRFLLRLASCEWQMLNNGREAPLLSDDPLPVFLELSWGVENEVILFLCGFGFHPPSLTWHLLEDSRTTQCRHHTNAQQGKRKLYMAQTFYSFQMVSLVGEGHFLQFCNKIHFLIQAFYVSFPMQSKWCEHVQRESLMWNSPQILN